MYANIFEEAAQKQKTPQEKNLLETSNYTRGTTQFAIYATSSSNKLLPLTRGT